MSRCEPANVGGASLRRPDRTEDIGHGIDGSMAAQCLGWLDEPVSNACRRRGGGGQAAHACFGGRALRSSMLAVSFFSGIYSRTLKLFDYIIRSYKDWASLYKEIEVMRCLPHPLLYPTGTYNVYPP